MVRRGVRSDDVKPVLDAARGEKLYPAPDIALMCAEALGSGLRAETARVRENDLAPVQRTCWLRGKAHSAAVFHQTPDFH